MYVPSYQMHNVLNVYSKQLRQNMALGGKHKRPEQQPADRINLTPEGKRRATIERVSKDILDKISRYGSLSPTRHNLTDLAKINSINETLTEKEKKTTFVFNAIDTINNKKINTLSVEDSSFLIQPPDQSGKEVGDNKTESYI
ncbi:MAG: hypothetical protein KJP23_31230 [Deltaproteobacteria bacterium]|nr:hypothetical protein [Deltaproteobacteria bacterium]